MAKSQPPWRRFPLVFPSRLRPSLAEQIRRATWVAESEDPLGLLGDGKMGKSMDCNNQHLGFIMIYQELDRIGPTITGLVVSIMTFMTFDRLGMEKSSRLTNSYVSRLFLTTKQMGT